MSDALSLYHDLVWQVEAGADEAHDLTAGFSSWGKTAAVAAAPPTHALTHAPAPHHPAAKGGLAVPSMPSAAPSLDVLEQEVRDFDGCALKYTAMNLVFAEGNPEAKIMCIGDAPSEDDDRQGKPFAGAAGKLLDEMMGAIGLSSRDDLYLTNLVFWRPPGNRTPSEIEMAACLPLTERHIALVKPKIILLMGQGAMKGLLRTKDSFAKRRGQWCHYKQPLEREEEGGGIACFTLYHPSYLLRQPAAKRQAWADLLRFAQEMEEHYPTEK